MLRVGMSVVHPEYGVCTLVNVHNNSAIVKTATGIDVPCFTSDLKQLINS